MWPREAAQDSTVISDSLSNGDRGEETRKANNTENVLSEEVPVGLLQPHCLRKAEGGEGTGWTHLSSPGGTPLEAVPASQCAQTDTGAQTPCAASAP